MNVVAAKPLAPTSRPAATPSTVVMRLQQALQARHPLIFLHTPEETRVMQALEQIAAERRERPFVVWTCTCGLDDDQIAADTRSPVLALEAILRDARPGFYVFKDLTAFMSDASVMRLLRDAYYRFRELPGAHLFIVSPELTLPASLYKNLFVLDIDPPPVDELLPLVEEIVAQYTTQEVPAGLLKSVALSLRGITLDEARHVLHSVMSGPRFSRERLLDEIRSTKKMLAAGAGFLEYVPPQRSLDEIGGLSRFKDWMEDRAAVFSQQAVDAGVPVPRGILIMGVSGCGKSLCAKAIAKVWNVPLFRLDMNLVFSQLYGNAEASFHQALRVIESMAPAVLWVDEIENGLGFSDQASPVHSHIFSAFLTWMQEKPPLVFVAATANRIESLPAEMIRKGRFDQVFFVDLPDEPERAELFEICLRRYGAEPQQFDMKSLLLETRGWNGAEIEQVVQAARIRGLRHKRPFSTADVVEQARHIVPLSRTMNEQIQALRDWAWGRATPASGAATQTLDG